jgi:hypothetical protein
MKSNLKGSGGIKGLLLRHGEKVLIAVVAVGAALLVYFALGVERLSGDYQAGKLLAKVGQTKASIDHQENNWNKAIQEHPDKVRKHEPLKKSEAFAVNAKDYVFNAEVMNNAVIEPSVPRRDPTFLAAIGVEARSGVDLFAFPDEDVKRRELLRAQTEEAQKQKEAERAERMEKDQSDFGGRRGRGGRRQGRGEEMTREFMGGGEFSARRTVEGRNFGVGAQLQGGELLELNRWVSVVAKVPVRAQFNNYRSAFEEARGGFNVTADFPQYVGYVVQRAEVAPGQNQLNWQDLEVYDAKGTPIRKRVGKHMVFPTLTELNRLATTEWAPMSPDEVVNLTYLDPKGVMVYPLPPVVGRNWGSEATHPDIPLAGDSYEDSFRIETPAEVVPTTPDAGDEFGINSFNAGSGFMERGGRMAPDMGRLGRFGEGRGRSRGEVGEFDPALAGGRMDEQIPLQPGINEWLLRFFDFQVQPGKTYKYQVQLLLLDPNQAPHVTANVLDQAVLDRLKKLKGPDGQIASANRIQRAPFSQPSPAVTVPLEGSVRMASVQVDDEPRVKLLVQSFGRQPKTNDWIQAKKERDFSRGGVANFQEDAEYLMAQQMQIDKVDSFPFHTGITVLDMKGGERLGGDLLSPSRVLLMDPAGGLAIRQEMDDAQDVQSHRDMFAKKKQDERMLDGNRRRGGGRNP